MDEDEREREKQKFSAQYFDGKFFTRLQNQYKSQFMQMFSKMLCYAIWNEIIAQSKAGNTKLRAESGAEHELNNKLLAATVLVLFGIFGLTHLLGEQQRV